MNSTEPETTAAERLDEIAEILAGGLMRLLGRKSTRFEGAVGESPLATSPQQRPHAVPGSRDVE